MALIQGGAVVLSSAQTGNGDSTNTAVSDKAVSDGNVGAVLITSAVGATPTVTVNIMGSVDGTNFYNVPYATQAAPETLATAAIVITTAVTTTYILRATQPWRYLKLVYSANTNVTLTATAYL